LARKAETDVRIVYKKVHNEGIAINTNKAIAMATGEYIAFLDHDDTLDPDALAESVAVLEKYPEFGLVYSDEDKISEDGERYFNPHYKPGFSLDMLRNLNYITHFVVMRKSIADKLGGIRAGFDGAQDYDFFTTRGRRGGANCPHTKNFVPLARSRRLYRSRFFE
jgi:O-antigen biosynthesis protein